MGLDYGTKTVGVAISDALRLTAQGIETIQRKEENKLRRTLARIEELVKEYEVDTIVLGFPKHMNNDVGERAERSLEFREMLMRRIGIPVVMWDERLTTVEAERTLIESQVRRENRKQYIDKIAGQFLSCRDIWIPCTCSRRQKRRTRDRRLPTGGTRMEKIKFCFGESEESVEFFVLEQTKINGASYLLVTDSKEDDAECLTETSQDAKESVYEIVKDDVSSSSFQSV